MAISLIQLCYFPLIFSNSVLNNDIFHCFHKSPWNKSTSNEQLHTLSYHISQLSNFLHKLLILKNFVLMVLVRSKILNLIILQSMKYQKRYENHLQYVANITELEGNILVYCIFPLE